MTSEYRIIFTATFATAVERDKAYDVLKTAVVGAVKTSATFKRADMTKDDYNIADANVTEKVI